MYSTTHDEIGLTAPVVAAAMATQVVDALRVSRQIEDLHRSLSSSAIIAQATGLVMALLETDAKEALAHLRRVSAHHDQDLTQVAEELLHTRRLPSVAPAPSGEPSRDRRGA